LSRRSSAAAKTDEGTLRKLAEITFGAVGYGARQRDMVRERAFVERRRSAPSRASSLTPFAAFYVEFHFSRGPHPHQQVLQGVRALVAGIEPLLQRVERARFVQRGQYVFFSRHDRCSFVCVQAGNSRNGRFRQWRVLAHSRPILNGEFGRGSGPAPNGGTIFASHCATSSSQFQR
jgi:hypothetical protein